MVQARRLYYSKIQQRQLSRGLQPHGDMAREPENCSMGLPTITPQQIAALDADAMHQAVLYPEGFIQRQQTPSQNSNQRWRSEWADC